MKKILSNPSATDDNNEKIKNISNNEVLLLVKAIEENNPTVVEFFLNHIELKINQPLINGLTALVIAFRSNHYYVVQTLLRHGADTNLAPAEAIDFVRRSLNNNKFDPVEFLERYNLINMDSTPEEVLAALFRTSIEMGNLSLNAFLVKKGMNPSYVFNDGETPITIAAAYPENNDSDKNGDLSPDTDKIFWAPDVVGFFYDNGADITPLISKYGIQIIPYLNDLVNYYIYTISNDSKDEKSERYEIKVNGNNKRSVSTPPDNKTVKKFKLDNTSESESNSTTTNKGKEEVNEESENLLGEEFILSRNNANNIDVEFIPQINLGLGMEEGIANHTYGNSIDQVRLEENIWSILTDFSPL